VTRLEWTVTGRRLLLAACLVQLLVACAPLANRPAGASSLAPSSRATEVVMFALGMIDTGYRFGGRNSEAGVDCSGMVSYVFGQAAGMKLTGSAAEIARHGRSVDRADLRPGDLVFFNTLDRPHSHVGIYIGDGRFVHAPSSQGKVRIDTLSHSWFASRFEEARNYFD
jgi:cell wall-associated NlpC family hydrolase